MGNYIHDAFARRPLGGPSGTLPDNAPQLRDTGYPQTPSGNGQQECGVCDLYHMLQRIEALISANPDYYPWRNGTIPPDGKAFDQAQTINMPTQAAGEQIVTRFTVNPGYDGIVLGISNNVINGNKFNPAAPDLIWRIRNGVAITNSLFVDGYSFITTEFGTTNQPRNTFGIFISSGQTLLYTITNNSPTYPSDGVQTTCCFQGFQWPSQRGGRQ